MAKKKRRVPAGGEYADGIPFQNRGGRLSGAEKPGSPSRQALPEAGGGGGGVTSRVLWASALVLIISGYSLLHKVDPGGQNAWAVAAPALLLAGYLLIIPSILITFRGKN